MDLVDRQDLLLSHSPMTPLLCHPGLAETNNTLQSLQAQQEKLLQQPVLQLPATQ